MKVCTDACILGAWTAMKGQSFSIKNILDIGCGTGLLSLMLVQKIDATIDAIEINNAAAEQAAENIAASPWPDRINIVQSSIQDLKTITKYDLIICNPPFYEDDLRSNDKDRNAAKHDTVLRFEELLASIKENLNEEGIAVVLLPFHRTAYFEATAKEQLLFIQEKLLIKQTPKHDHFRSIILLSSKFHDEPTVNELIIHDGQRNYTEEFKDLLNDYYQ